jgi:hypothetical protein
MSPAISKKIFNEEYIANHLEEINTLIQQGHSNVTCSGDAVVWVRVDAGDGTTESTSISLDTLARGIIHAAVVRNEDETFTDVEQIAGVGILNKLQVFYFEADEELEQTWTITKILHWIRNIDLFLFNPSIEVKGYSRGQPRVHIFDNNQAIQLHLRSYSLDRYRAAFPEESIEDAPVRVPRHSDKLQGFISRHYAEGEGVVNDHTFARIQIKEQVLRARAEAASRA